MKHRHFEAICLFIGAHRCLASKWERRSGHLENFVNFDRLSDEEFMDTSTKTALKMRPLGRSGMDWSVLTFGCWQAGGKEWTDTNDDDSLAALHAAYQSGIRAFDTAEGYGGGHSETIVGRFLKEVGAQDIRVATKVGAGNLSAKGVQSSCENSLRHLGLECVDLYQIHWPAGTWGSPIVAIAETMEALENLKKQGKIRAIGVSNFNGAQIEEALEYGSIESLQPPYSLFFQPYVKDETLATCQRLGLGVLPYSPMAQGLLTGKFNQNNKPTDNRANNHLFKEPTYSQALQAVESLQTIATRLETTTACLSLAWLLAQPGVTSPIVGARTPQQIRDLIPAAALHLDAATVEEISELAHPVLESQPQGKTNPWAGG